MSFVCPICNASFQSKGALVKHIKNLHPGSEVIIPRKIRNSVVEEPVSVAPIVAPEPVVTSVPIVNNEVEILKAQHAHEIMMLNNQHQANLELQAVKLELEFVKSQNELLKGLLDKALSRPIEVSSISRGHIVEPEPVVSAPIVSKPEPVVSEPITLEPLFSEKKVSNNKQNINSKLNSKLDAERPDAVPYDEFLDYALGEDYGVFTYNRKGEIELSKDVYKTPLLYNSDSEEFEKWVVKTIKRFMSPAMDVSSFEIIGKKVYVKNEEGIWVDGSEKLKRFTAWVLANMQNSLNHMEQRINANRKNTADDTSLEHDLSYKVLNMGRDIDDNYIKRLYNKVINA